MNNHSLQKSPPLPSKASTMNVGFTPYGHTVTIKDSMSEKSLRVDGKVEDEILDQVVLQNDKDFIDRLDSTKIRTLARELSRLDHSNGGVDAKVTTDLGKAHLGEAWRGWSAHDSKDKFRVSFYSSKQQVFLDLGKDIMSLVTRHEGGQNSVWAQVITAQMDDKFRPITTTIHENAKIQLYPTTDKTEGANNA